MFNSKIRPKLDTKTMCVEQKKRLSEYNQRTVYDTLHFFFFFAFHEAFDVRPARTWFNPQTSFF